MAEPTFRGRTDPSSRQTVHGRTNLCGRIYKDVNSAERWNTIVLRFGRKGYVQDYRDLTRLAPITFALGDLLLVV